MWEVTSVNLRSDTGQVPREYRHRLVAGMAAVLLRANHIPTVLAGPMVRPGDIMVSAPTASTAQARNTARNRPPLVIRTP